MFAPWKKRYDQPSQHIKKQRHFFANKGLSSQSYGFSKDPDPGIEPMPYTSPTLQVVTAAMKLKDAYCLEENL